MEKVQLSKVFRLTNGKSISSDYSEIKNDEYFVPIYGGNSVLGYAKRHLIDKKTLVIGRVGEYCGNINLVNDKIWVSDNALYISEWLTDCDINYLFYVLTNVNINRYSDATGQPKITQSLFKRIHVFFPIQITEQTAIATILSKVDEAIEATRNSIKAAENLKKALMQNLLTGKLKPDGTWRTEDEFYLDEKYGKVPVGWNVLPVGAKSLCDINPNYRYIKGKVNDFISMDAIKDGFRGVDYLESKVIEGGGFTRFKKGDILFAKITPCTENGKIALIDKMSSEIGFASTEFIVFHPKESIDGLFFYYLLSSSRVHRLAVSLMEGTTGRQRVPGKIFKNRIITPIPKSIDEQKEIANKIKAIELTNSDKQLKIQRLQRLKKSLMQNLLTGKVRLPEVLIKQLSNG